MKTIKSKILLRVLLLVFSVAFVVASISTFMNTFSIDSLLAKTIPPATRIAANAVKWKMDNYWAPLKEAAEYCTGTSNCHFAMKYGMKPMGTHPHEWFMFHGAQFGYKHANYMALENWVNVYDGDLGIALSDTYTSGIFLSNLSRKQAKLFDGVRCDSGDEFDFTDKLVARYRELGIDPTTKTIVFSNALDFGKALDIQEHCRGKIRSSFGIGTNLTNDTGFKPSNIVMKLTQCKMNVNQEWRECVKLSDDAGKHIGSEAEVRACLYDLRLGQQIEPLC